MRQRVPHLYLHLWQLPDVLHHWCVVRAFALCAIGMVVLATTACGELEPMVEPEIIDLQLTMDTLKTQVRDAQRNLAEVRTELESRRQELADAQVARAQLEGRVREAERRVTEARHVIELQREELIAARAERERVFRSSSQLQSQMKQLQKKASKSVYPSGSELGAEIATTGASLPISVGMPSSSSKVPAMTATLRQSPYIGDFAEQQNQKTSVRHILVKPGDTLWSLSRKYGVDLNRLRSINYLNGNQIMVGQILSLSENRAVSDPSAEPNR